ncbi:MAG TPA: GntR family transcriptional regulator [Firmicutes bacterium]|nr:GntR family transcriptional regulator [Bacillota bacterium]
MNRSSRTHSLEDWAYEQIRDMIIDGRLRPGQSLTQEELATMLNISRTPLRRALAQLESHYFLEFRPHTGIHIRQYTLKDMIGIFEVRNALEGLVCRLVAPTIKASHIAYLEALITEAYKEAENGNIDAYLNADREFHGYLVDLVEYDVVKKQLPIYQILSMSYGRGLIRPPKETYPEHLAILKALAAHDAKRAEKEAVRHTRITINHLRELLAKEEQEREQKGQREPDPEEDTL